MNSQPLIITIDGPAGVGKTTLAGELSESLGIACLDTGAMFRAVGWILGNNDQDLNQEKTRQILADIRFSLHGTGWNSFLCLNSKRLGPEIRTEEAGIRASNAGRNKDVRAFLKKAQKDMGLSVSLVAEGRDMGTVVFPDAAYKFFLDAAAEVRAQRRVNQLQQMGVQADYDAVLKQIIIRDEQDRNREIAPLKPAIDALIIDTGRLSPAEVLEVMKKQLEA